MSRDRYSVTQQAELITDPDEKARREAENGLRQFRAAMDVVRTHVHDPERPFSLRQSLLFEQNKICLDGLHLLAGTYRNVPTEIKGSKHVPPEPFLVPDKVQEMCEYVNVNWHSKSAIHLSAYILWRLNWIHPFADGNGRTSRMVSYIVLCVKLNSILPGTNTVPDQIARNKGPYYDVLEAADAASDDASETLDVSNLEELLESRLARQLADAADEASSVSTS